MDRQHHLYMQADLWRAVKKHARENRISVSASIRELICKGLSLPTKEVIRPYCADGQHSAISRAWEEMHRIRQSRT